MIPVQARTLISPEVWRHAIDVVLDGRAIMVTGIGLVLWALLRPEAALADDDEAHDSAISIEAYGGKTVVLAVKNIGQPFILGVRAQLMDSTERIDHHAPYEYDPRPLGSGETLSQFTIAEVSDDYVRVFGEHMRAIQGWSISFRPRLEFKVAFTFFEIAGAHAEKIDECELLIRGSGVGNSHDVNRILQVEFTP